MYLQKKNTVLDDLAEELNNYTNNYSHKAHPCS